MSTIFTAPAQATPQMLTEILRRSGYLCEGEIVQVHVVTEPSLTANIARLNLTYSGAGLSKAPTRLFLKMSNPNTSQTIVGREQWRHEVDFHNHIATMMGNPPVVRCYDALFDDETGLSHLLFDDVSDTHSAVTSTMQFDKPSSENMIASFAQFHAYWWDHPSLGVVERLPDRVSVAKDVEGVWQCFPRFANHLGDRLEESQRVTYDRVLAALPELCERVLQGRNLTLIHGDAFPSNVLLPVNLHTGKTLIIDWQLWGISFAAEDLSNLMALSWDGDKRHALERDLLAHYHHMLLRNGVNKYEWHDCWHDYRLAILTRVLFMPMWQWSGGLSSSFWWPNLQRAMTAYKDLDCAELLPH